MKSITTYITEKLRIDDPGNYNYFPETKEELRQIIDERIKTEGPECDLNDIDVSKITNMSELFYQYKFNGDISKWDVSNVINMEEMFTSSSFNGDISKWNVSNVTNMHAMFNWSKFNGDISNWNVSNVKDMNWIFGFSDFDGDISNWKLNKRCKIENMLAHCPLQTKPKKWPQNRKIINQIKI